MVCPAGSSFMFSGTLQASLSCRETPGHLPMLYRSPIIEIAGRKRIDRFRHVKIVDDLYRVRKNISLPVFDSCRPIRPDSHRDEYQPAPKCAERKNTGRL